MNLQDSELKTGQISKMKGEVLKISTSAIVKPLIGAQIYSVSLILWCLKAICINNSSHIMGQEFNVSFATLLSFIFCQLLFSILAIRASAGKITKVWARYPPTPLCCNSSNHPFVTCLLRT